MTIRTPDTILLAHGNGGRLMRELIERVIFPYFDNPILREAGDSAVVPWQGELVVTSDGFTVDPLRFPGGDIGKLAACGAINDLAVAGAEPKFCTLGILAEEGLALRELASFIESFAKEAAAAGMQVVAGDTKVLKRGQGGGLYLNVTAGGQPMSSYRQSWSRIGAGDRIGVTGSIGEHAAAVLLARQEYGLKGRVVSDCASVLPIVRYLASRAGVKWMRDPTRGGVATVCHEIAAKTGLTARLFETQLPISPSVAALGELIGGDPLYWACEGRIVFVAESVAMDEILAEIRHISVADRTVEIGHLEMGDGQVLLETPVGGVRWLAELEGDALPRIC